MSSPETRASLLLRVRDPEDTDSWRDFVAIYAPLVHGYCRRRGLQDADAADVAQDVFLTVSRRIAAFDYDPGRGTFRGWLFRITRNQLSDWFRHRAARAKMGAAGGGTDAYEALQSVPDESGEAEWERLHREELLRWAAIRTREGFREATWEAFWRTFVDGRSVAEVAAELGLSAGAVYIARSRVLSRLRAYVEDVLGERV